MAWISYIGDLALSPSDELFLVESDSDYVSICNLLASQVTSKGMVSVLKSVISYGVKKKLLNSLKAQKLIEMIGDLVTSEDE